MARFGRRSPSVAVTLAALLVMSAAVITQGCKDQSTQARLKALSRPDDQAANVADMLEGGIVIMDGGNALYVDELAKAPAQSVEERSMIFEKTGAAMGMYLEGLDAIIASFWELPEYAKDNKLDGEKYINTWINKFEKEKQGLEDAMRKM